jgi:hypothetical protein
VDYSRELNFINVKNGSSLTVEIRQPEVVHKDGTASSIGFTDAPSDSVLIGTNYILTYGSTQPVVLSASTDTLKLQYAVRTVNAAHVLQASNATLSFTLSDAKSGKALGAVATRSIRNSSDTASALYEVRVAAGTVLNLAAGTEVTITPSLTGARQDDADMIATLGHIYRFAGEGAKEVSKEVIAEDLGPKNYLLEQNYPNPFNPSTTLRYALPEAVHVTLAIYNTLGQKVAELVDGDLSAGYHEARWEAAGLASGIYFARLTVTGGTGQILMTSAYREADAATIASFEYVSMLWGLAFSYLIFGEVPGLGVIVGGVIVIAAGIFIIFRERQLGLERRRERSAARTTPG